MIPGSGCVSKGMNKIYKDIPEYPAPWSGAMQCGGAVSQVGCGA